MTPRPAKADDRPVVRIIDADLEPGRLALERTMLAQARARRPELVWTMHDDQAPASAADAA